MDVARSLGVLGPRAKDILHLPSNFRDSGTAALGVNGPKYGHHEVPGT